MKIDKFSLCIVIALFACLFYGCKEQEVESIAQVDDASVTPDEFLLAWNQQTRLEDSPATRQAVLDDLVYRNALVQAAVEKGLLDDPETARAIDQILINRFLELELQPSLTERVASNEQEIAAYYEANKQQLYSKPEAKEVAVLWFDTRNLEPLEMRYLKKMEKLQASGDLEAVPAEKGFGKFSVKHSEHAASRYRGGLIGRIGENTNSNPWLQSVASIAKTLTSPGEFSDIITRPEGIFWVRLVAIQPASVRSYDSVKNGIAQKLKQEKRLQTEATFREEILAERTVQIDENKLMSLELPTVKEQNTTKNLFAIKGLE